MSTRFDFDKGSQTLHFIKHFRANPGSPQGAILSESTRRSTIQVQPDYVRWGFLRLREHTYSNWKMSARPSGLG